MTLAINHKFVDTHADGTDATLVRPSNWNDTHAIQIGGVDADTTGSGSTLALATAPTFAGQVKITMPASGSALFINGNAVTTELAGGHRASVHVQGLDGENCGFHADAFGTATNPTFFGRHALGTLASPSAETIDTLLVRFAGRGYRATGYSNNIGGMGIFAAGTFTDTSTPTYVALMTCPSGSTNTQTEGFRVTPSGGVSIGGATFNATDRASGILALNTSLLINANTVPTPGTVTAPMLVIQAPDATRTAIEMQCYGSGAQTFSRMAQRRFGGTAASPTATPASAVLGNNLFGGWTGAAVGTGAIIQSVAINLWSGSDTSAYLDFQTVAATTTSLLSQMRLQGSGGWSLGNGNVATDPGAGGALATFFRSAGVVFASLPSAVAGIFAYITDSNTATWGATIAGLGSNKVLGWYNGTNWTVVGA